MGRYHRTRLNGQPVWERDPREATLAIPTPEDDDADVIDIPDSDGLEIQNVTHSVSGDDGARDRTVSMFPVDRRTPATSACPELCARTYAFQPQMEVTSEPPFPIEPVIQAFEGSDWYETVARLHCADFPEYATRHGVSAEWDVAEGRCHTVRTVWISRGAVHHTRTTEREDLVFSMRELGRTAQGAAAEAMLTPLVAACREWIDEQSGSWTPGREGAETAAQLVAHARLAADRMTAAFGLATVPCGPVGRGSRAPEVHREPSCASSQLSCRAAMWLSRHLGRFKWCVREARTEF